MTGLLTLHDTEDKRDKRIDSHRHEFGLSLLDAMKVDDGAMVITIGVAELLNKFQTDLQHDESLTGFVAFLIALRMINANLTPVEASMLHFLIYGDK